MEILFIDNLHIGLIQYWQWIRILCWEADGASWDRSRWRESHSTGKLTHWTLKDQLLRPQCNTPKNPSIIYSNFLHFLIQFCTVKSYHRLLTWYKNKCNKITLENGNKRANYILSNILSKNSEFESQNSNISSRNSINSEFWDLHLEMGFHNYLFP